MLEFSRSSQLDPMLIDLKNVIDHSIELSINIGESKGTKLNPIRVSKEIATDLPMVLGSGPELQQVILNLLRNARQALASDNYAAPNEPVILVRAYHHRKSVVIEVEDNGPGISDEVKRHMFEPFYTTKDVGQGTGLGLSVSYFIITEHHKGKIIVECSAGKGTIFKISLPLPESTRGTR